MSFSERFGYEKPPIELSEDDMPPSLRSGLWDCIALHYFSDVARHDIINRIEVFDYSFQQVSSAIWFSYFRKSIDTRPSNPYSARQEIRDFFFRARFHAVYDFLEFMCGSYTDCFSQSAQLIEAANLVLERELA